MKKMYIFENTKSLHVEEALVTMNAIFTNKYQVIFVITKQTLERVEQNDMIMKKSLMVSNLSTVIKFLISVKKEDIVVFPTITARNILTVFFLHLFINKKIYYIRNSNSWLKYSTHNQNITHRVISHIVTFFKKILLKNAYQLFTANTNLKHYLEEKGVKKEINIVPYKFFDTNNFLPVEYVDELRVVIPGGIDISKKDLPLVRRATQMLSKDVSERLTIILLGKPSKQVDLEFCEAWKNEVNCNLIYYTSFIPDSEFTFVIQNAHYVLGILQIEFEDKYNKEIYGESKDTGVDAQAISYGKPLIINKKFKVANEIASSVKFFQNDTDLAALLSSIDSEQYKKDSQNALENCQKLSLDSIVNNLIKI